MYGPSLRPLGRIKNKHCWQCGKMIYMYVEVDHPQVKNFCGWDCSDAYDKKTEEN